MNLVLKTIANKHNWSDDDVSRFWADSYAPTKPDIDEDGSDKNGSLNEEDGLDENGNLNKEYSLNEESNKRIKTSELPHSTIHQNHDNHDLKHTDLKYTDFQYTDLKHKHPQQQPHIEQHLHIKQQPMESTNWVDSSDTTMSESNSKSNTNTAKSDTLTAKSSGFYTTYKQTMENMKIVLNQPSPAVRNTVVGTIKTSNFNYYDNEKIEKSLCNHAPSTALIQDKSLSLMFPLFIEQNIPELQNLKQNLVQPQNLVQSLFNDASEFCQLLCFLFKNVFPEVALSNIFIFYDADQSNITAFNQMGELWFNLRYFIQVHKAHNVSKMVRAFSWFNTICHELSHTSRTLARWNVSLNDSASRAAV